MATHKIAPQYYTRDQAIMITLGVNPKTYWIDAPVQSIVSNPQMNFPSVQPQMTYQQQPQMTYQPQPQMTYQPQPQMTYQPQPQMTYQQQPQMTYQPQPQMTYQPQPQMELPSINTSLPSVGQFGMNQMSLPSVDQFSNTDGYFSGNDDSEEENDESQD
jgi:hypothetical protein